MGSNWGLNGVKHTPKDKDKDKDKVISFFMLLSFFIKYFFVYLENYD